MMPRLTAKARALLDRLERKSDLRPTPAAQAAPQPGRGTLLSPQELDALLGKPAKRGRK